MYITYCVHVHVHAMYTMYMYMYMYTMYITYCVHVHAHVYNVHVHVYNVHHILCICTCTYTCTYVCICTCVQLQCTSVQSIAYENGLQTSLSKLTSLSDNMGECERGDYSGLLLPFLFSLSILLLVYQSFL